jgi:hypothetical protein
MSAITHDRPTVSVPETVPALLSRLFLGVVGTALAAASIGLWVVPGAEGPGLALIKLGLSIFLAVCGLSCLACAPRRRGRGPGPVRRDRVAA